MTESSDFYSFLLESLNKVESKLDTLKNESLYIDIISSSIANDIEEIEIDLNELREKINLHRNGNYISISNYSKELKCISSRIDRGILTINSMLKKHIRNASL